MMYFILIVVKKFCKKFKSLIFFPINTVHSTGTLHQKDLSVLGGVVTARAPVCTGAGTVLYGTSTGTGN